jgi:hypothetical protein
MQHWHVILKVGLCEITPLEVTARTSIEMVCMGSGGGVVLADPVKRFPF